MRSSKRLEQAIAPPRLQPPVCERPSPPRPDAQMMCVFLSEVVPLVDANVEEIPSDNNLFDLIPASKLRLDNVRASADEGHDVPR